MKLKSFPTMSLLYWMTMRRFDFGGIYEEPLNLVNYGKKHAMRVLENTFQWEYYGGKHYESVFTKFYQAYVLPNKFNVDKRKSHYSALIRNNEITRSTALVDLSKPLYDKSELIRDMAFVKKKLGFTDEEFDQLMNENPVDHAAYPSDQLYIQPLVSIAKKLFGSKNIVR